MLYLAGWWFGTAVGSTPTSRCGRALPIVERFVHRFRAMDLIMDLADVDTGGRFSAVVKVVVFGPAHERHLVRSVLTGSILVLGGLFDGASDVLTLLDVVLVQLFSIPSLKVDDVTRVLYQLTAYMGGLLQTGRCLLRVS